MKNVNFDDWFLEDRDTELTPHEIYLLALIDIVKGTSIAEIEKILKQYEEKEQYIICAAIHKAIKIADEQTIKEIKQLLDDEYNEYKRNNK